MCVYIPCIMYMCVFVYMCVCVYIYVPCIISMYVMYHRYIMVYIYYNIYTLYHRYPGIWIWSLGLEIFWLFSSWYFSLVHSNVNMFLIFRWRRLRFILLFDGYRFFFLRCMFPCMCLSMCVHACIKSSQISILLYSYAYPIFPW